MSEEITTPERRIFLDRLKYLGALYHLGLHETMLMMEDGKLAYDICTDPNPVSLKFL